MELSVLVIGCLGVLNIAAAVLGGGIGSVLDIGDLAVLDLELDSAFNYLIRLIVLRAVNRDLLHSVGAVGQADCLIAFTRYPLNTLKSINVGNDDLSAENLGRTCDIALGNINVSLDLCVVELELSVLNRLIRCSRLHCRSVLDIAAAVSRCFVCNVCCAFDLTVLYRKADSSIDNVVGLAVLICKLLIEACLLHQISTVGKAYSLLGLT